MGALAAAAELVAGALAAAGAPAPAEALAAGVLGAVDGQEARVIAGSSGRGDEAGIRRSAAAG